MDTRKPYVAPAVTAEDELEQTSLACSVTALPQQGPTCAETYRKFSAYFDNSALNCASPIFTGSCVIAFS